MYQESLSTRRDLLSWALFARFLPGLRIAIVDNGKVYHHHGRKQMIKYNNLHVSKSARAIIQPSLCTELPNPDIPKIMPPKATAIPAV